MKHFTNSLWKAAQTPISTVINGFGKRHDAALSFPNRDAISYPLSANFVRTFATSGLPFLTYYEFNDLTGWCRDTYFAPDHVEGYKEDIGKSYTIWTHEATSAYRRHIILDEIKDDIHVSFEVPFLHTASWFPLRICLFDRDGLYFQNDQKLVVERLSGDHPQLTSWKKIPQLNSCLPDLQARSSTPT